MATFTVEITPDYSNGTIAHAVGKFSGGSSSYKGQRRMDVTISGVRTFSALSPETSGGENTFSLDITGLTPGTTYNWSASLYYKNTSGNWVTAGTQYDKSGSFTTANSGTTSTVPLSAKAVRSTVKLNVNGAAKEFIIVHKGKPSSMYDDSCDGVWLLMKDIYEMRQWNSNSELLYENSSIHSYLNSTFLNLFDANIRDAIKQVKIPYLKGGKGGSVQSGANGLSCKVFLLSGYELNFRNIFPADGAGLDGFAESITNNSAYLATYNGTLTKWWLRSISTLQYSAAAGLVSGYSYNSDSVTKSYGIRPCIILPPTTLVDDSGNVVTINLTAHKTLINGTAYTVKGGKCLVNGTVYSIKKGRTLIGGTGYDINFEPSYDPVFANNTWEQIIAACHNNEVPDTWKVADHKPMTINGVDYQIDIIGKNHDDYSDGSGKAPLTFQLHDCYADAKQMNSTNTNNGGWTSCAMRSTHLPAILALMPTEVQNGIREVNKLTSAGNQSATINTTADKLFLLSEVEIFGRSTYSKSGEGAQYDYYKAGNSKVKNRNGSTFGWWERSPVGSMSLAFCFVQNTGNAYYSLATNTFGVAFGFCF
jgi:hypothetical protein